MKPRHKRFALIGGGLRAKPGEMALAASALAALQPLFGDQPIAVHGLRADDKAVQYSSDLAGALA